METRILEGKPVAAAIRSDVESRVRVLKEAGRPVGLAVVLVGDDPASRIYSASIAKAGAKLGIDVAIAEIDPAAGPGVVAESIRERSEDPAVSGIIVQQPLPGGIPPSVVDEIDPRKDVDGASTRSMGLLAAGRESFAPATPLAVVEMLAGSGIPTGGRHVVIVGRSPVVGRPLASLLLRKSERGNATVTVCHTGTPDVAQYTRLGDVVVAAMGRPEALKGDMVREGAVVIDVGVNSVDDPDEPGGTRVVGDVAFDEMLGWASAVTPVPGGVGSLTTAILLRNTIEAAERAAE